MKMKHASVTAAVALLGAVVGVGALGCAKGMPVPGPTAMVRIPAGTFQLGSNASTCGSAACAGEYAEHPVTLTRAFDIETTEVTRVQMAECAAFGGCCDDGQFKPDLDQPRQPARATLDQARAYCAWRKLRLPTEAEWEVAARAKDQKGKLGAFPWTSAPGACAVPGSDCPGATPADVGTNTFDVTPLGVHDMGGSLSEWVEDDYVAAIGCRHEVTLQGLCPMGFGDTDCASRICGADGKGCHGDCSNAGGGAGFRCNVGGTVAPGHFCPVPTEPVVDPLRTTFDHAQVMLGANKCGVGFNSGGANGNPGTPNPMSKGGGVDVPSCLQDPGMRVRSQDGFGSGGGNNGDQRARHGFRCVTGAATAPGLTTRLSLARWPRCGPVAIALAPGSSSPTGWGTRMTVALETNRGGATATFNAGNGQYELDLGPVCTNVFPDTINRAVLVIQGAPGVRFALQLTYDSTDMCTATVSSIIDLSIGEHSCPDDSQSESGSCL